MLPQHSKITPQRQLLNLIRLLARQNAHLNPVILPKLHDRAIRNTRSRPLHLRILIRTPQSADTNGMADRIVINIQRGSIRSILSLILTRDPSFQIRVPRVSLQIAVEMVQTRQDVEVLVAGRGGERLGELRGAGERLGRRAALQLCAEELLEQRAEVHFGACGEWREEDVQAGWEAGGERCWDGVVVGGGPADVQFVALFEDCCDLAWMSALLAEWNNDIYYIYAHLSRQVLQTQCQALLQRSAAGVAEDDGVWVDVDAIGVDARAFWLYECDALLHCAVVLGEDIIILLRWKSTEHVPQLWESPGASAHVE